MAAREFDLDIAAIDATLVSIEKVLDLPKLRASAIELEAAAGVPDLWDDPENAQKGPVAEGHRMFRQAHLQGAGEAASGVLDQMGEAVVGHSIAPVAQDDFRLLDLFLRFAHAANSFAGLMRRHPTCIGGTE